MDYSSPQAQLTAGLARQFSERERLVATACGYRSETFSRLLVQASTLMVGGTVYATGIGLLQGDVVANMSVLVFVAGSGVTLSKVGLYDSSGNRLALSADQGSAWQATGLVSAAMITPYTVPVSGMYYAAMIATASTTLPTMARLGTTIGSAALPGFAFPYASMLAQSDLPSALTLQVASGSQAAMWAGVNLN